MKTGVMYKDEVWTGIEYQVATNMIYDNMINEGLSIVRGIHERYSPEKHNPWNEAECGDHYARAMASWGVLLALEDYNYDGPEGQIIIRAKTNPAEFRKLFYRRKRLGKFSQQQQTNALQKDEIQLKYGELHLKQFTVTLVGNLAPKVVSLYVDGKKVPVKWERDGQKVIITGFDQTFYAGANVKAEIETGN